MLPPGENPLWRSEAIQGPPQPPLLAGESQGLGRGGRRRTPQGSPRRLGAAEPGPGEPAAPSRCLRLPASRGGGGGARHPPGAEGAASLAPCVGNRPGHLTRPKAPNVGKGGGGAERRGSRRSAAAVLAAKLTSSYRGLRAAPLPLPGRGAPRALVALCSRGSFPRSLPFLSLALPVLAR